MTSSGLRTLAVAAIAAAVALPGCASASTITATGTVDDTTRIVAAPLLLAVTPDPDAGFSPAVTAQPGASPRPSPVAAVMVTDAVPLGARVRQGDVVARVDSAASDDSLAAAKADKDLAGRRVSLIESQLDDVLDKRDELNDKRRELDDAIAKMKDKRPELVATRADLRDKQKQLAKQLKELDAKRSELKGTQKQLDAQHDQLGAQIADLEQTKAQLQQALQQNPGDPTLQAQLEQVTEGLAKAKAGLKQLSEAASQVAGGLAQLEQGRAKAGQAATQLAQGLAKLDEGIRTIDANLAKARDGRTKLDDGLAKLADAETKLGQAHELAQTRVTAAGVSVGKAREQQGLTTLFAPADGLVVATSVTGDVVRPGAPVVTIRPDTQATVTTWLSPPLAGAVCPGSEASATTDWGTTHTAHVTRIGLAAEFPPTSQATDEVHLTRAVEVTLAIAGPDAPPPGAGVDLILTHCKENRNG